ncbi:hypothetical protein ABZ896_43805 [Streptomyces sp. NPDC047072]|uniref:hypothetical protein n=1 Tax=Streptomyces sp. NPDC047072 TaxID=3154809 RepID=UPI0033FD357E
MWAYVQLLGIDRLIRLTDAAANTPAAVPALTGGRLALPYRTVGRGQLTLDVGPRLRHLGPDTADAAAANTARGKHALPLPYVTATAGTAPAPVKVTVSDVTVKAEPAPSRDGTTAELRLPARLKVPSGRQPVTLPKAPDPIAYAVVRDQALLRLEGPAYRPGPTRRLLTAAARTPRIRRVRRRLSR